MNAAHRSHFVYVTVIRTTPAKLWEALTEPQFVRQYWFNTTRRASPSKVEGESYKTSQRKRR
jgi:uncharacterized protein YndB with AHSA1/START domain